MDQIEKQMNRDDKIKQFEREVEMIQFYSIAQKYGFCNPYCECGMCRK